MFDRNCETVCRLDICKWKYRFVTKSKSFMTSNARIRNLHARERSHSRNRRRDLNYMILSEYWLIPVKHYDDLPLKNMVFRRSKQNNKELTHRDHQDNHEAQTSPPPPHFCVIRFWGHFFNVKREFNVFCA